MSQVPREMSPQQKRKLAYVRGRMLSLNVAWKHWRDAEDMLEDGDEAAADEYIEAALAADISSLNRE